MAAHSIETLLRLWALNQLTAEQAIGQTLQILADLEPRVKRVEQSLAALQAALPKPAPPPQPAPAPLPQPAARRKPKS